MVSVSFFVVYKEGGGVGVYRIKEKIKNRKGMKDKNAGLLLLKKISTENVFRKWRMNYDYQGKRHKMRT